MGCCGSTATVPPDSSPLPAQAVYQRETVQPTQQTLVPSSTGTPQASSEASSSKSSNGKPAPNSAQPDDKTNSTLPPTPHAATLAPKLARGRSQGLESSLYHGGGGDSRHWGRSTSMDPRNPPAGTQPVLWAAPARRHGGQPRFSTTLKSLLHNDFRFRILVVGKRESGKSSLINAIFKVNMSGAPINVSGRTEEFRPRENRHLIVHECSGSGPRDLQAIRDSITTRNHTSRPASERLHAIWICVPTSDAIDGQFDNSLKELSGIGVPLILVFTKFDKHERDKATAYTKCEEHRRTLFGNVRAEPVSIRSKFRDLIEKLVTTTDEVINAHSRETQPQISPVTLAWSVSQRTSRDINIRAAIERSWAKYLWYSGDFAGQTLADCVEVIHADIVGVWNLPDKDRYLSSPEFKVWISYLMQDLSGSKADPTPGTGAAWLNNRYENINENICLIVGYIVDLTLILCSVFRSSGNVSPNEVQSAMNNFADSSLKTSLHTKISRFIESMPKFKHQDNDVVVAKIIDLIRQNSNAHI
ncbi:hypothetical protein DFH94DRAFT_805789 [Russula ochroleuca]|uniref:G domain-containing protein n=1 Tax=Russula ochroleuca TaxID=152965 RepID=A0A9P5K1T3_9AGAM|nr:hypothetical protein DFH94DRAFT_805789 [Russula ochroleuca]